MKTSGNEGLITVVTNFIMQFMSMDLNLSSTMMSEFPLSFRLSPQTDTPYGATLTPPLKNHSDSQIDTKHPYRAPLMSDGAIIDGYPVRAASPGSGQTPSPDKELNKSKPTSSLKFTFRSLPKKFSRSAWPFHVTKVKGHEGCNGGQEVSPGGMPSGRLQPEGKEEELVGSI